MPRPVFLKEEVKGLGVLGFRGLVFRVLGSRGLGFKGSFLPIQVLWAI